MQPVTDMIKERSAKINVIHMFSNGPSSQYRQKKNFFLFNKLLFDHGFSKGTWNFFESGHGKGAADGIGAALKRAADDLVARGTDIPDAETFYRNLKSRTTIDLFFITKDHVKKKLRICYLM